MMDNQSTPIPRKSFSWILVIFLLVSMGIAGWLYYQNLQLKQQSPQNSPTLTALTPSPSPDLKNISFPKLPIVVFEPPLSNNDYAAQRAEIQQKIVDPYLDYYKHAYGENYLVSLLIQTQSNENIKNQYPYGLIGIMNNGSIHEEALMQTNNVLSWWTPTCMGPCDYSEAFKQKYPQIVSTTNP